ncbi:hypothetical protein SAMN05518672_11018 [Chitinophaga sp. CF118]|uniref:hypothetical protein n=1 Tax=Chitinophaga sp. CF118 TaxID=1884367 RepID=UPI0008E61D83|nr:hypothetical protein [Chitinophaga sp. CF118]SFE76723.1 hypothetical protein SAMN05518672_11018 [Chitinophaga sp. CF118]
MKKKSEKKLQLGKIKIASLNQTKKNINDEAAITLLCLSNGIPMCSLDICRFN